MDRQLAVLLTLICVACGAPDARSPSEASPPNFVLFIIDDLGWIDTGVYGSSFYETPHIDQLAREGARFTQFYAASPVCSPTRASIMTGKHPARVNITNWIGGEQYGRLLQAKYERELGLDEVTIGEAFEAAGYAMGYIGKWHLGAEGYLPDAQGFEFIMAVNHAGQPGSYFYPYENEDWPITNVPDLEDGVEGEYLTDRLTDEALSFLELNRGVPFLLVLSHYAVHTPLESKNVLAEKYKAKARRLPALEGPALRREGHGASTKQRQDHPVYAGMIESTDESVGRVLSKLEELGLESRTVVIFVSDNGGLSTLRGRGPSIPTSNLPLRAGKGWLYEGGIRVPLIVKWPGVVSGGAEIDVPTTTMDLYPTILEIAGLPSRPEQHRDGLSIAPLLRGDGGLDRDALYWHFPHYHGSGNRPSGAIRDEHIELYDLVEDPGEKVNLVPSMPEMAEGLRARLHDWRSVVDARMPTANPNWRDGSGE
jgi:arylsulfatase A-like enzyme